MIRSPQNGPRGGQEDRRRRQRGSENDPLRGGRSLHRLDRGRGLRKRHCLPPARPGGRGHAWKPIPIARFRANWRWSIPTWKQRPAPTAFAFKLDNPDHELRPGMFAAVTINTPLETIEPYKTLAAKNRVTAVGNALRGVPDWPSPPSWNATEGVPYSTKGGAAKPQTEFLVVPEQAVVDTGAKKIVYVQRNRGCSKAWKSNWDRGRMISTRCSRGWRPAIRSRRRAGSSSMPKRGSIRPRLPPISAPAAVRSPASVVPPAAESRPRHHVPMVSGHDRLKPATSNFPRKTSRTSNNCRKKIGNRPRPRRHVP